MVWSDVTVHTKYYVYMTASCFGTPFRTSSNVILHNQGLPAEGDAAVPYTVLGKKLRNRAIRGEPVQGRAQVSFDFDLDGELDAAGVVTGVDGAPRCFSSV